MTHLSGDAMRRCVIGDADLEAGVHLMQVLTEAVLAGGMTLADPKGSDVDIPVGVLAPLLDLLAILITKREGYVMILDGYDDLSAHEAAPLLRVSSRTMTAMLKDGVLAKLGRQQGKALRLTIKDVLALAGGNYDSASKKWIMPKPDARTFGPPREWRNRQLKASTLMTPSEADNGNDDASETKDRTTP